ncbi:maleylpyruvate isomerase family mycothiol-dependent enzyme [Actinomadura barringtoniae]|uniref:Maleylpyruvate isomerase family mycothiol-dependent enzyme n=1 Tax=Actinomadura barringtoniae TaxID=1427535 RepID=A0A939PUD8_9ACTN|nr:maleylpyruvate isomerase family mycothiol-dependent enzyme [Actinomadura barringtoniae]MBO2455209.1 maleylpyruvate isomerase family mycothiol-dependent enzyme [Actinomadura barringtoniae]
MQETPMAAIPLSDQAMRDAAVATAEQLIALMESTPDPEAPVPATSPWSITDVFGHVAMEPGRYRDLALGEGTWPARATDLPAFNDAQIAALPSRDIDDLAAILRWDLKQFIETLQGLAPQALMMFDGDQQIRAGLSLGTLIGEFVVHGYDIGRATGRRWPIDPAHVPLVLAGMHQVMPGWVDADAVKHHKATYRVHLRGGPSHTYRFEDGALTIDPASTGPIDVHISAEPVTWLLLTYGRANPIRAALTGKVLAYGRRPWLAPRLAKNFLPA